MISVSLLYHVLGILFVADLLSLSPQLSGCSRFVCWAVKFDIYGVVMERQLCLYPRQHRSMPAGCILQFIVSKLRHDVNREESVFLYV